MELKDETAVSISKRKRVCTETAGIERLPDAMLCHILSFLATSIAVRTSVLSKRWRYVWTSVPSVSIMYPKDAYFTDYFDRLLRLNTVSCLRKLRLHWSINYKRLDKWISTLVERDIEELDLNFWGKQQCVKLPPNVLTCKKLVTIKLNERILVDVPSSVCLPSLKILDIHVTELFDQDSMKNLLDGCPVIEELKIKCEEDYNVQTLFLRSPSLKILSLNAGKFGCLSDLKIVVDLPNVEQLDLRDYGNAQYDVNSLSSLTKVEIFTSHSSTLVQLLGKFSNTEYMKIASETRNLLEYQRLDNLPMFHNLTHLKVNIWDPCLPVLPYLLECSPNLVTFVYSVSHKASHQQQPQFKAPNCLMLCLVEIKLTCLKGFADEMEMIRFFLKNSMVLKKLSVMVNLGVRKQLEFTKKLLTFPRGSSDCEIIYD